MGADGSAGSDDHPWRRASAQVLVEDLSRPRPDRPAVHHLTRVLRLGPDEQVCAFDGRGGWVLCSIDADGQLAPLDEPRRSEAPEPALTVGFAALKGSRNELVVQKLTELGVDRIWLLRCERSVVRWDDQRAQRHLERLARTALEACCQCRRLWLPAIEVLGLGDAVSNCASEGSSVVLADAGGGGLDGTHTVVLVGPEGGWAPGERGLAPTVGLGENVLRAETAAIVAGATMGQLRVGLQGPGLSSLSP